MTVVRNLVSAMLLAYIAFGPFSIPLHSQDKPEASQPEKPQAQAKADGEKAKKEKELGWKAVLPEKGLEGWEITDFGSQGRVQREKELLVLEMGDPLTGINLKKLGDFPKDNFEIELECKRVEGNDFLCGLTFPVADEFCTFIAGGWGGGLVGLSSVNGFDASENSTASHFPLDNDQWYKFRVAVNKDFIKAWIGEKEVISQERENNEFSTRIEVFASQPLGLCVFQSTVEVRNFRWRPLPIDENETKAVEVKK